MHGVLAVLKYLMASVLVGTIYGAVAGAAFGATIILLPGESDGALSGSDAGMVAIGMLIGGCVGSIYGIVFGLIGGAIGGPAGWTGAGYIGVFAISPFLEPKVSPEWFHFIPATILATIGLFIGIGQVSGTSSMPLTRWLHRLWKQAYPLHQSLRLRVSIGLLGFLCGIALIVVRASAHSIGGFRL